MNKDSWRYLSEHERAVLMRMLSVGFPGAETLKDQVAACRVRNIDANGSLEIATSALDKAKVSARVPVEGEYNDSDDIPVHVLLHVVDEKIKELEIYKEDLSAVRNPNGMLAMEVFTC